MKKSFLRKIFNIFSVLAIISQSLTPYAVLLPQQAYAQEVTSTPTDSPTPTVDQSTVSATPTPSVDQTTVTPSPTDVPTDTVTPTPTDVPTDTVTPTPDSTATPTDTISPTDNSPPSNNNSSGNNSNSSNSSNPTPGLSGSTTPIETTTPTVTIDPTQPGLTSPQNPKDEKLNLIILNNISAPSLDLGATAETGSAILSTNKPDYAPTDTALITGSNLLPNTTYSLHVWSNDAPATSTTVNVTSDANGVFAYAYQLDGTYRPNYSAELKDQNGTVVATTTFTDSSPFGPTTATNIACMGDQPTAPKGLTCTANDIQIASVSNIHIVASGPDAGHLTPTSNQSCDYPGEFIQFTASWNVQSTATTRYNVGLWFASQGQTSALNGSCSASTLPSTPSPFFESTDDSCGDINSGSIGTVSPAITLVAQCNAAPGTNLMNLPYCTSWDQNEKAGNACSNPVGTVPGAPSKCSCNNGFTIPVTVPPGIEVIKNLVPSNDPGLFNLQVNGSTKKTDATNGGTTGKIGIATGQNTFGEANGTSTDLNNYNSTASCVLRGTQTTVTANKNGSTWTIPNVTNGQDIVCTITNTRINNGSITLDKVTNPSGNTTSFSFTTTGFSSNTTPSLTDTATPITWSNLSSGNYSISEIATSGWTLSNVSCIDNTTHLSVTTPTGLGTGNIALASGQNVTCTFTNTQDTGTITVNKTLVPSNDPGKFNLQIDGTTAGTGANVGNNGTTGAISVLTTNTHTVSETQGNVTNLADYTATYSCSNNLSGNGTNIPSFSITKGQNVICTFTNTRNTGSIKVNKLVDTNGDGTFETVNPNTFTWSLDGSGTNTMGASVSGINTGTHTVNESTVINYHLVGWYPGGTNSTQYSCTNLPVGNQYTTLPASLSVTTSNTNEITICNARDIGTIQVKKIVNPADNSQWDFTISGNTNNTATLSNGQSSSVFTSATGSYTISEVGHTGTTTSNYNSSYVCSDANGAIATGTGTSAQFNLTKNETVQCTFTNSIKLGTVTVTKYQDNNANGTQDNGELNLSGWTINLGTSSAVTDQNGQTVFNNVLPSTYTLSENIQNGWYQSNISCTPSGTYNSNNHTYSITVVPSGNVTCTVGNYQYGHVIVTKDVIDPNGNPIVDTTTNFPFQVSGSSDSVSLTDGQSHDYLVAPGLHDVAETTNANYDFAGCTGGTAGVTFAGTTVTVTSGSTTNVTCTNKQKSAHITVNKVVEDSTGKIVSDHQAFTVQLNGANDISNLADNNPVGYTVKPGGPFTISEVSNANYDNLGCNLDTGAPATNFNLTSNQSINITCTNQQKSGSISGYKYQSNGTTPIPGWGISLFSCDSSFVNCSLNAIATTVTNTSGFYNFSNLVIGFYKVVEDLVNTYTPMTVTYHNVTIAPNTQSVNNNFSNFKNVDLTVCKVYDTDGDLTTTSDRHSVSNWTMTLNTDGKSTTTQQTNVDGCTVFSNLGPGHDYSVTEELKSGWTNLTPLTHDFGTPSDGVNQNYTFINFQNGSISGEKFNDLNGNGTLDQGENGLAGWTIQLLDTNNSVLATTTTDANGNYSFINLGPSTYRVREVGQTGWTQKTVNPSDVVLTSGQNATNINFGNQGHGTITVHKLVDRNGNSTFTSGDNSEFNWNIDGNGSNQMGSTVNDIPAGQHTVGENSVSGYHLVGWFPTGASNSDHVPYSCANLQSNTLPIQVNVGPNGTSDYTICNQIDSGHLIVNKITNPSSDTTTEFNIVASGSGNILNKAANQIITGGSSIDYQVTPGTYNVNENSITGWNMTDNTCSNVVVDAGATAYCTITNTQKGKVIVTKFLDDNANGINENETQLNGWDMTLDESTQTTAVDGTTTFNNVTPGVHNLSETQQDGWNLSKIYCTSDNTNLNLDNLNIPFAELTLNLNQHDVNVNPGQTVYCYVGNYQKAHITVIKDVVKANGDPVDDTSTNFNFNVGNVSSFQLTDGQSNTVDVTPGSYDVTEQLNNNYDFGKCTAKYDNESVGSQIAGGENVIVNSGDSVIVTCVNKQKPATLTIVKNALPSSSQEFNFTTDSDSGTPLSDFTLVDNGTNLQTKTFSNLNQGTYSINENPTNGWDLSNITCNGEVNYEVTANNLLVDLASGDNITCTFTNKEHGKVIVTKYNDLNGNGKQDEGEPNLPNWEINLSDTTQTTGEDGKTTFDVTPGGYILSENIKNGWEQTQLSCNTTETTPTPTPTTPVVCEGNDCQTPTPSASPTPTPTIQTYNLCHLNQGNHPKWNAISVGLTAYNNHLADHPADYPYNGPLDANGHPAQGHGADESNPLKDGEAWCSANIPQSNILTNAFSSIVKKADAATVNSVEGNDNSLGITVNPGEIKNCVIGNHNLTPKLTLTKVNDAVGNKNNGDTVTYTLTVTADETGGPADNVTVTDLLPSGFHYVSGSWQALYNGVLNGNGVISEPTYHSPGVWTLGHMNTGDVYTLIYKATIDGSQQTGTYYDNAWAQGTPVADPSNVILASATSDPALGNIGDPNFVGTQVALVNGNTPGTDYKSTITQSVLGASTELPSTGESTVWVIIATLLAGLGISSLVFGIKFKKRYEK